MRPLPSFSRSSSFASPRAFTLIELLTVVAIMSVLSSVAVIYMASGSRHEYVSVSASGLANALVQARSEAIARNTLVQLRVVTVDSGDSSTAGRAYSLWAKPSASTGQLEYQQITNWTRLNQSVSILDGGVTGLPGGSDRNVFSTDISGNRLTSVPFEGRTVEAAFVEFSPMGGIRAPSPASSHSYILLAPVQGQNGSALGDRATGLKPGESNWRKVRIANLTGQIQVQVPEQPSA